MNFDQITLFNYSYPSDSQKYADTFENPLEFNKTNERGKNCSLRDTPLKDSLEILLAGSKPFLGGFNQEMQFEGSYPSPRKTYEMQTPSDHTSERSHLHSSSDEYLQAICLPLLRYSNEMTLPPSQEDVASMNQEEPDIVPLPQLLLDFFHTEPPKVENPAFVFELFNSSTTPDSNFIHAHFQETSDGTKKLPIFENQDSEEHRNLKKRTSSERETSMFRKDPKKQKTPKNWVDLSKEIELLIENGDIHRAKKVSNNLKTKISQAESQRKKRKESKIELEQLSLVVDKYRALSQQADIVSNLALSFFPQDARSVIVEIQNLGTLTSLYAHHSEILTKIQSTLKTRKAEIKKRIKSELDSTNKELKNTIRLRIRAENQKLYRVAQKEKMISMELIASQYPNLMNQAAKVASIVMQQIQESAYSNSALSEETNKLLAMTAEG